MKYISGNTFAEVYKKLLLDVYYNYDYETSPRGMNIREIMNCCLKIENPTSNLFKNSIRGIPLKYLKKELALYLSARNDLSGFEEASKFWKKIANDNGTINSAYGYLIFEMKDTPEFMSQWQWAKISLERDKDSRQAVLHFNRPKHQYIGVKDFPCTLELVFHIRNNRLNLTTVMRSNDVIKGTTFDIPFFTILQQLMYLELKTKYPELEIGTYEHIAHSMHLYESDFELVKKMLEVKFESDKTPKLTSANIIQSKVIMDISRGLQEKTKIEFYDNNEFYHWIMDNG